MNKTLLTILVMLTISCFSFAQSIGIGKINPDVSSALDITATNKGLLIPRMSSNSINAIANPAKGLMVYDSVLNTLMVNTGTPGSPKWQATPGTSANWNLIGNTGINPSTQFIGNTDNTPLRFRINNIQAGELNPSNGNIFWGLRSGQQNQTGFSNIAIGAGALISNTISTNLLAIGDSALFKNGLGNTDPGLAAFNTAIGSKSLFSNTTGSENTATGFNSLFANTTGNFNTAFGYESLVSNTTGSSNTGAGLEALFSNRTGSENTSVGYQSLFFNSTGNDNTATGFSALSSNTTGIQNTAFGSNALFSNSTGNSNIALGAGALFTYMGSEATAIGTSAMFSNSTGLFNTAVGFQAMMTNRVGNANTAVGYQTLLVNTNGGGNTAIGNAALTANTSGATNTAVGGQAMADNLTGSGNTSIGFVAMFDNTTGSNNTAIGQASMSSNIDGSFNTAVGLQALTSTKSSQFNTAIGYHAGFGFNMGFNNTILGANSDVNQNDLFNCIAIGQGVTCTASNQARIGNSATNSIGGFADWTNFSDGRFKKNIQESVKGIDFIMQLRPVTYQLDIAGINNKLRENKADEINEQSKKAITEKEQTVFSGFVAQEVEEAARKAGYEFSGVDKPKNDKDFYGLRYSQFVVPLVKAVQEQQQMINDLKKLNKDLQARVIALEKNKGN